MGKRLPGVDLKDTGYHTLTQQMIHVCTKLQKEKNLDFDTAYQEAFNVIKAERTYKNLPTENPRVGLASSFKDALQQQTEKEQSIKANVKDIFLDK